MNTEEERYLISETFIRAFSVSLQTLVPEDSVQEFFVAFVLSRLRIDKETDKTLELMNTDKKTLTQTALILKHLKEGNSITALEALYDFGCFRLASRISELKKAGWDIESAWKDVDARKTGKKIKIKEYKLHVTSWQTYRVR